MRQYGADISCIPDMRQNVYHFYTVSITNTPFSNFYDNLNLLLFLMCFICKLQDSKINCFSDVLAAPVEYHTFACFINSYNVSRMVIELANLVSFLLTD